MKKPKNVTRRAFIKISGAAAAVFAAGALLPARLYAAIRAWSAGMVINPNIDNNRVVCCFDPAMLKGTYPLDRSFGGQNNAVDAGRVEGNMDNMAKELAQKPTPAEAWALIFQKPAAKQWNAVKCAIKVNGKTYKNMPRIAVVAKLCKELINLGVTPANIVVYDGDDGASGATKYTPYVNNGLPAGVQVSVASAALGGTMNVVLNHPAGAITIYCTRQIADGTVDILVNCGVNKHTRANAGNVTLCMKNHMGTFQPGPAHNFDDEYMFQYIMNINKHDAILGGTPVRQQLCVIDSLWASNVGEPDNDVTHAPARLVMGIFAPVVDYVTATKIHRDVMGGLLNTYTDRFVTEFGYTTTERDALQLINVAAIPTRTLPPERNAGKTSSTADKGMPAGDYTVSGRKTSEGAKKPSGVYINKGGKTPQEK